MNSIPVEAWLHDPEFAKLREEYYSVKLNCGHLPSDPTFVYDTGYTMTTGYGTAPDGKRYCHECCAEQDRAAMKRDGRADLYLSSRGNQLVVSTWPGKIISQRVKTINSWRNNFGDSRTAVRFCFNGEIWSGIGQGPGMYLRCRRTKFRNLEGEK
jgi:hypothetical protein